EGLIEPYFSLAIDRTPFGEETGPGGFFSIGELPPVSHSDIWVSTPVVILDQIPINVTANKRQLSYWALEVQSVYYGSQSNPSKSTFSAPINLGGLSKNTTSFNTILDNGNSYTFLPSAVAE